MPRNSCSLTNGPDCNPLPRTMTLVSEMRPRDTNCKGQNDTMKLVGRAMMSAALSGYNTAYVFGTASANT